MVTDTTSLTVYLSVTDGRTDSLTTVSLVASAGSDRYHVKGLVGFVGAGCGHECLRGLITRNKALTLLFGVAVARRGLACLLVRLVRLVGRWSDFTRARRRLLQRLDPHGLGDLEVE